MELIQVIAMRTSTLNSYLLNNLTSIGFVMNANEHQIEQLKPSHHISLILIKHVINVDRHQLIM
jgi:hypothetical protein